MPLPSPGSTFGYRRGCIAAASLTLSETAAPVSKCWLFRGPPRASPLRVTCSCRNWSVSTAAGASYRAVVRSAFNTRCPLLYIQRPSSLQSYWKWKSTTSGGLAVRRPISRKSFQA
jgi:hypothetical protein